MEKGLTILIFLGLFLPLIVLAQIMGTCPGTGTSCPPGKVCIPNPLCAKDFPSLIDALVGFIWKVAFIILPLIIVIAGANFMFSGGNPEQIKRAKDLLYYAGIGLIIIFLAKGVIELFKKSL